MPNTRIIIQKTMAVASCHVGTPVHSAREGGGAATRREGSGAHRGQGGLGLVGLLASSPG
jgi:hypothetical protein